MVLAVDTRWEVSRTALGNIRRGNMEKNGGSSSLCSLTETLPCASWATCRRLGGAARPEHSALHGVGDRHVRGSGSQHANLSGQRGSGWLLMLGW